MKKIKIGFQIPFKPILSLQEEQLENRLFNNPLISDADLATGNYDPKIITSIDRFKGTDRWFCKKCSMRDDKWGMMKHHCKNNKNNFK